MKIFNVNVSDFTNKAIEVGIELYQCEQNNIHPCMMDFLREFLFGQAGMVGYYNGDHIICLHPGQIIPQGYIPLLDYGYEHLVESFYQMTDNQKDLLKFYFDYKKYINEVILNSH